MCDYYGAPSLLERSFLSGVVVQKYSQYCVRTFLDSLVFHIETVCFLDLSCFLRINHLARHKRWEFRPKLL